MNDMSFSDDQLLNLVNNRILTKSEFKMEDFTGGGVQITSTYNHKIIKHKIYLTFGYDDKRNSRSYAEDIEEDVSFIWHKAILLKVKSMQTQNLGSSLSELNKLMNTDSKIEIVDNKDRDSDKECNDIVPTSLRKPKEKKLTLKQQTEARLLEVYDVINLQAFNEWMDYKKYKSIAPVTKTINFLCQYDPPTQQQIVDTSIMNNYKGLFEPKGKTNRTDNNIDVAQEWLKENDTMDVEVIGR